jgi:HK97 family phage portal protein
MGLFQLLKRKKRTAPAPEPMARKRAARSKANEFGDLGQMDKLAAIIQGAQLGTYVSKPFEQSASVYKAIMALADNVPQAELAFREKKTKKEIYPEDLLRLMQTPNPLMSGSDFIQACTGFYALYGECFIVKQRSLGQVAGTSKMPAELWTFNPKRFERVVENKVFQGWRYNSNFFFPKEDVIHIKSFNPYDDFRGFAPTAAGKNEIDIDYATLIFNKAFFDNDATPGFYLSTDKRLTAQQKKDLLTWYKKQHSGASRAFNAAVFDSGLKPGGMTPSHKDMDFIEQKRYTREEILGIWRVPKALLNITDGINYATFQGQMKVFWLYALVPILKKFEAGFNRGLVNQIDASIEFFFDLSNVPAFLEDFYAKIDVALKMQQLNVPLNDINEKLNLGFKPYPWGNTAWLPLSVIPADQYDMYANGQSQPPASDPKKPDEPAVAPAEPAASSEPAKSASQVVEVVRDFADLATWKRFLVRHSRFEPILEKKVSRFFMEQRAQCLSLLKDGQIDLMKMINWDDEKASLHKYSKPVFASIVNEGAQLARELTGYGKSWMPQKALTPEEFERMLDSYIQIRADKITNITDTVRNQIREILESATASGATISELAQSILPDQIREVYNMAGNRAMTIARTETTGALNGGSDQFYAAFDVWGGQWLNAGDEATRTSHMPGTGVGLEIRPIGIVFSNGLLYPGDINGPAKEIINCRCTKRPIMRQPS